MLERFDLGAAGFQSATSIHLQAEAKRLAYEDRARYYADPNFTKLPDWCTVQRSPAGTGSARKRRP